MAVAAAALPILTAIGGGISAGAAVYGGIQQSNMASYQAQVAENNAAIAESNAQRALQKGQIEAQEQDALTMQTLGEQETIQGASGLSLGSKSAVLTRKSARELGRLDALRVIHGAEMEAYNKRIQAADLRSSADASRAEGGAALIGGFLSGAGSLVSAASTTVRDYRTLNPAAAARSSVLSYGRHTARIA